MARDQGGMDTSGDFALIRHFSDCEEFDDMIYRLCDLDIALGK